MKPARDYSRSPLGVFPIRFEHFSLCCIRVYFILGELKGEWSLSLCTGIGGAGPYGTLPWPWRGTVASSWTDMTMEMKASLVSCCLRKSQSPRCVIDGCSKESVQKDSKQATEPVKFFQRDDDER